MYGAPSSRTQLPDLHWVHGHGSTVYDSSDQAYLDLASGSSAPLGHGSEQVSAAVALQTGMLAAPLPVGSAGIIHAAAAAVSQTVDWPAHVVLCSSHEEAMARAVQLSHVLAMLRQHGPDVLSAANAQPLRCSQPDAASLPHACETVQGSCDCWPARIAPHIVALRGGVHGTAGVPGALSHAPGARAIAGHQAVDVSYVLPDDSAGLADVIAARSPTALVLPGAVTHDSVHAMNPVFAATALEWAAAVPAPIIVDESSVGPLSGAHRWAHAAWQAPTCPDMVVAGCGIANGLPIGALLVHDRVLAQLPAGAAAGALGSLLAHAPTVSPVPAAAVQATLRTLGDKATAAQMSTVAATLHGGVSALAFKHSSVIRKVHRVHEHCVGLELLGPAQPWVAAAARAGVLVQPAGASSIALCPARSITAHELRAALAALDQAFAPEEALAEQGSRRRSVGAPSGHDVK